MAKVVYAVKNCSVAKSQFEEPVESEQYLYIYSTVVEGNLGTLYRSSHRNSFGIDLYGCTYSTRPYSTKSSYISEIAQFSSNATKWICGKQYILASYGPHTLIIVK